MKHRADWERDEAFMTAARARWPESVRRATTLATTPPHQSRHLNARSKMARRWEGWLLARTREPEDT